MFLHTAVFPSIFRLNNIHCLNWIATKVTLGGESWNMCHHYKFKNWKKECELEAPRLPNAPNGRHRRFSFSASPFHWSHYFHYLWPGSISDKMYWTMMDFSPHVGCEVQVAHHCFQTPTFKHFKCEHNLRWHF